MIYYISSWYRVTAVIFYMFITIYGLRMGRPFSGVWRIGWPSHCLDFGRNHLFFPPRLWAEDLKRLYFSIDTYKHGTLSETKIHLYNYTLSTTMTKRPTLTYFLYFRFSIIFPIVLNIHIYVLCTVFDSVYGYKNN